MASRRGRLHCDRGGRDEEAQAGAVGPKQGTPLGDYFRGRVDKACGRLAASRHTPDRRALVMRAELVPPYAVLLRTT